MELSDIQIKKKREFQKVFMEQRIAGIEAMSGHKKPLVEQINKMKNNYETLKIEIDGGTIRKRGL